MPSASRDGGRLTAVIKNPSVRPSLTSPSGGGPRAEDAEADPLREAGQLAARTLAVAQPRAAQWNNCIHDKTGQNVKAYAQRSLRSACRPNAHVPYTPG